MRFAHVAGLTALVYISLVESEFILAHAGDPVYKKDLTEQEVHTANGLVNKSVFRRVKKEGKIVYIRNHQINESNIKVRVPLKETQNPQEETALSILMDKLREWESFRDKYPEELKDAVYESSNYRYDISFLYELSNKEAYKKLSKEESKELIQDFNKIKGLLKDLATHEKLKDFSLYIGAGGIAIFIFSILYYSLN